MLPPRDIAETIRSLPKVHCPSSRRPAFRPRTTPDTNTKLVLGVASMQQHMTDEGWQLTHGLSLNSGYVHCGHGLPEPETNAAALLSKYDPSIVVVQDKREWHPQPGNFRDPKAAFRDVTRLRLHASMKLTVLKDSQQRPEWHKQSADEMGVHAWIVYYHPEIVKHLAQYVRKEDCLRTYHTLNPASVPEFKVDRSEHSIMSGAISNAYPLRLVIRNNLYMLSPLVLLSHPGYHRNGCCTTEYMNTLSNYKVAVCTSSRYGYTLRKIIEATAVGCRVITDLPIDDTMPEIDGNLIRIHPSISMGALRQVIHDAADGWDAETQRDYATKALWRYDYIYETNRLAMLIEEKHKELSNGL